MLTQILNSGTPVPADGLYEVLGVLGVPSGRTVWLGSDSSFPQVDGRIAGFVPVL